MKVEIRPALYGTKLRYEAYEVQEKPHLFKGSCLRYKQLYFRVDEDGVLPVEKRTYEYFKGKKSKEYRKSTSCLDIMDRYLKACYGNRLEYRTWRPSND